MSQAEQRDGGLRAALEAAAGTVRRTAEKLGPLYPDNTTRDGWYPPTPAAPGFATGANYGWTTGFVPGMHWLCWDLTADPYFRDAGLAHAADFRRRLDADDDMDTHDLGFLYTLSCVAAWRYVGDDDARATAVCAAERLMTRFLEPAGIVQAWGLLSDPAQRGRTIIDSLMNMPLLTFAHQQTGDERYADAVRRHTAALRESIVRTDGSTFHSFYWDPTTGSAVRGATEQGAGDDSCWARGQAWGIYGFALNHRATGDPDLLAAACTCADYFLAHLPPDRVPYWDLMYGEGSGAQRDSSAGAIAVCGLLEIADLLDDPDRARSYRRSAADLLAAVERCRPDPADSSDALLLHAVYDLPKGVGVDEGCLWGDYFYLESLARLTDPQWRPPW